MKELTTLRGRPVAVAAAAGWVDRHLMPILEERAADGSMDATIHLGPQGNWVRGRWDLGDRTIEAVWAEAFTLLRGLGYVVTREEGGWENKGILHVSWKKEEESPFPPFVPYESCPGDGG